ncbi:hypothetical protein B0H19DRAFT_1263467 [Mycena capillaripes]|nr:hypothetical protein B0H19DRAFT_1263467 [Mycena capillaripes]
MISSVLVLVPFIAGINALNDWSVPCTTGECSYDLPNTNNSASGSLKIWGSNTAITDITTAADWQILGCNSTALQQDIRLVCMNDPDDPNSKCAHLYQDIGAVNKIVRLPEDCGASAFARVSKSWVPDDQSIPSSVRRRLVRRDGKAPVVKALSLDTNFDQVDYSKTGPVNIAIQGANVPGAPNDIQTPPPVAAPTTAGSASRMRLAVSVKDGIDNAAGAVKDAATDAAGAVKDAATAVGDKVADAATAAAGAVKDAATDAASKVEGAATKAESAVKGAATKAEGKAKDAASKAKSAVKGAATKVESKAKDAATKVASDAKAAATKVAGAAKAAASDVADAAKSVANNTIDISKELDLKPLVFNKNINLVNSNINCGKVSASLQVDMDANANAQVSFTVAATGTIVPPKMTKFGVVAGLTANVAGTMTMTADVTGHVDSGKIQLVNLGIPGLDFPGLLTIGPSFTVSAQVVGDVDVVMDMTVGINMDVNNAQLAFPPDDSNKPLSSAFSIGDTPLTVNAAPDVTATGTLTGHLIPSLNLGVSALGGKAKAQIFLDLDTNAALQMNLDGSASATKVITPPAIAASGNDTTTDDGTSDDTTATDDSTDGSDTSDDGSSTDSSSDSTGELFQTDDGELVDADGNPVDQNGAPLPDGASPIFVDQDGNIISGGDSSDNSTSTDTGSADSSNSTSTDTGADSSNSTDTSGELFQTDDGELVDADGNPVDQNGAPLPDGEAPIFVDQDGNIISGGDSTDNSTSTDTGADSSNSTDTSASGELFQTDDGELVDADGNPVDQDGAPLPDGASPLFVDQDGNLVDAPTSDNSTSTDSGDAKQKRADDAQAQLFQGDNGELVNEAGDPKKKSDENGKALGPNDPPVFVDADGNVVDGPTNSTTTDDGSDSGASTDQIFQTDDGELVDANNNPVDASGNLLGAGDAPVCEDQDGNVIDCPASVTDNAAATNGTDSASTGGEVFQTDDGELVDADGNPVDADGNPLADGEAPICEDQDGNVIDCPASVTDGTDTTTDDTTTDGTDTTKSLGGCINVNAAVSVNAGAEGSFFGLFDKFANAQLFNKNFKIFTKCFGDQATAAATATDSASAATASSTGTTQRRSVRPTTLERRISLTCPLANSKKLGVTKGTVKSSSIKTV